MKKNKILLAALASAAIVGCTDDSLVEVQNNAIDGLHGKQVEAGLLAGVRGGDESATRAYTAHGRFVWMPTEVTATGALTANRLNQKVGFCWTGKNNADNSYSAVQGAIGSKVYTNYEYEHVGWLDKNAKSPSGEECYENDLRNGAYIVDEGTPAADFGGAGASQAFYNGYYHNGWNAGGAINKNPEGKYTPTTHSESSGVLNLGSGIFRTNNASVFEGEYLVYYPYTDAFTKGEIVAHMPVEFDVKVEAGTPNDGKYIQNPYAASSENAFAIGYINHYKGGNAASSFNAKTLNSFVGVRLGSWKTSSLGANVNIKTVMLYSETQGIMYTQKLDAAACVTALKADNLGDGTGLFCGEPTKKNVVYANLTDGTNPYATVEGTVGAPAEYLTVVMPVFPQTISDLQIILVNENDQTLTINVSDANKKLERNEANIETINLDGAEWKNEYMVVDEASLWSAWDKVHTAGTADLTKTNVIKMLNDIRLEKVGSTNVTGSGALSGYGPYHTFFFKKNVLLTSPETVKATLTLASEQKMSIKGNRPAADAGEATLTIDVPVIVEGAGCCENEVAALVVGNANNSDGKVVFTKDVTNHGTLVLNNNVTNAQSIEIKGTLTNAYDQWAVAKNKKAGAADLYMLGTVDANLSIATLNNLNGKAIVAATAIKAVQDDAEHLFHADFAYPVKLHDEVCTDREVDVKIGSLTNDVLFEIHKKTMVSVSTSFKNTKDAVLLTQGEAKSDTDGRIDIAAATSENAGVIDNQGVSNFTTVSLTNTGLFIDRQSGQVGGKMIFNGTSEAGATKTYGSMTYKTDIKNAGIYVAQVETTNRLKKILGDQVIEPSTNIVEILGCDAYFFNMYEYADKMEDKDMIINAGGQIVFKSYDAADAAKAAQLRRLAHCVTVLDGNTLKVMDGRLVVVKDVMVEANGAVIAAAKNQSDKSNLVVQGSVVNAGTFTNNANYFEVGKDFTNTIAASVFASTEAFKVKGNVTNNGKFTSQAKFEVGVNVTNAGTFTSEGDENIVGGNFTQTAGASTFAPKTTTTIEGAFSCTGGSFERLTVGGDEHRATVNVDELGSLAGGTTSTAWPTEF